MHAMPDAADRQTSAEDQPGNAQPPAPPKDRAADRFFSRARMEQGRAAMLADMRFSTFAMQIDQLEYRSGQGGGYGWDAQAWHGGDIDRLVITSEGEGGFRRRAAGAASSRGGAERIEVSAMWRHALDPWFNLQMGVRQDFRPDPQRTYALVGIEGLAPYWFDVTGQLLVSNKGDVHARGKAAYQQRITQFLVVEPEAEIDLALQDVPALGIGAGFERIELGARLRYDRNRSLAPYLGVHWERKLGETARRTRAMGEGASAVTAVLGVRAMF